MSLRHGLLGLLVEGPASGYDLARRFQDAPGRVWPAQHPKIYAELRKLADEELIEVAGHGARRRTSYRLTDAGLAELRRWLTEEDADHTIRFQPLLRSLFLYLMDPDDLARYLAREVEYYREMAAFYADFARRKDAGEFGAGPAAQSMRVAADGGVRLYRALAEWATETAAHPPETEPGSGPGRT